MLSEKMTSQECVIIFAYIKYIEALNNLRVKDEKPTQDETEELQVPLKPHRPEPKRKRLKKPKYTLDDLLSQMPEYDEFFEAVKSGNLKPHRPEPKRKRSKKPKYTLDDLLSQETEEHDHGEWDTGDPVGNEVW